MIGVDVNYALCQTYSCNRRTKKWTTHFYMNLLNVVVANSLVLYNNTTATLQNRKKITKLSFIHALRDELIPVSSSNIIQNTRVKKNQHKRKIKNNTWSERKAKKSFQSKATTKNTSTCRDMTGKRKLYHHRK